MTRQSVGVWILLTVACSTPQKSGDEASGAGAPGSGAEREWRCYVNPSPEGLYCECKLGTKAEFDSVGYADVSDTTCPESNYKCCEDVGMESGDQLETCICWNPETIPACKGTYPIVPKCP